MDIKALYEERITGLVTRYKGRFDFYVLINQGQKLVPQSIQKIAHARRLLDEAGFTRTRIEVNGNFSFDNVPLMVNASADIIAAGTGSLFIRGEEP